ncbi:MAG: hypothetical protein IPH05_01660 [Flavobacteriales bacterium]|jgi:hypothetical protein|nr:hypothetical protein [Flavobacteriales bacterium]MBK6881654.1 hypothetical protein [Flavobacteriales bacterium]MBK7103545.1 hypothetical protein [Flavobacteriales bacterium]MBK7113428.1 hypothetical protein [Flavobacteriales bacterium]MBK7482569.1 hypothetical protein [Flavobacteriales bacterium]
MNSRPSLLRTLLLVVALWSGIGVFAQPGKTKVVLYKDRLAAAFDTVDCVKNVVKFNPLAFFRGEIPVYFERALSPRLSLEVGVGVTLRNYLVMAYAGDDADEFGAGTEIIPRPSFQAGFRYYLVDDIEPNGSYVQTSFAHLNYTKDIRLKGPTGAFTDDKLRDDRTYNDVRVLFGYQQLSSNSNWLFDVYGGVGYRDRLNVKVQERIDFTTDQFTYSVEESKDQTVAIFLGVKFGIGF